VMPGHPPEMRHISHRPLVGIEGSLGTHDRHPAIMAPDAPKVLVGRFGGKVWWELLDRNLSGVRPARTSHPRSGP
jgi:hypothetical protein